jgi:hypothetical protein
MRMETKLLKVGLSLLVVSVAVLAAYGWYGKTHSADQTLADTVKKSRHVLDQYLSGGYGPAKAAMLDHISLLDRLNAESGRPDRNPYSVDAMAWYVRLAKLEERNDGSGKAEYMREASARCEKLGWADCSEENLRLQVDRMDTVASQH